MYNKQRYEEAQCKIERFEAESGSVWELREKCAEQEAAIDGFEEEAVRIWKEKGRLKEKDAVELEAKRAGFKRMATKLEEEKQQCAITMVAVQCLTGFVLPLSKKLRDPATSLWAPLFCVWLAVRAVVVV